jgi:hypothetical protein
MMIQKQPVKPDYVILVHKGGGLGGSSLWFEEYRIHLLIL